MAGCQSLFVLQLAGMIITDGMNYSWTDWVVRQGRRPWNTDGRVARCAGCATNKEQERTIRPWSGPFSYC